MGGDQETEVAQNLRAEPVAQSDIFEPNQVQLRSMKGATGNLKKPAVSAHRLCLLPGTRQKRFCVVYGFRFVNGRLVASSRPASEVCCPRLLPSGTNLGNEGHRQPQISGAVSRFGYPQRRDREHPGYFKSTAPASFLAESGSMQI